MDVDAAGGLDLANGFHTRFRHGVQPECGSKHVDQLGWRLGLQAAHEAIEVNEIPNGQADRGRCEKPQTEGKCDLHAVAGNHPHHGSRPNGPYIRVNPMKAGSDTAVAPRKVFSGERATIAMTAATSHVSSENRQSLAMSTLTTAPRRA